MPKVKVWNDNTHAYSETFKGEKLSIPSKGFIEMEWEEAIEFKGQFTGVAPLGEDGAPDPKFFKMIRVDHVSPELIFKDDGLTNHVTGKKADSAEDLVAVLSAFKHLQVKDPEAEKGEIDSLRSQVKELKDLIQNSLKPQVGRPRKEA